MTMIPKDQKNITILKWSTPRTRFDCVCTLGIKSCPNFLQLPHSTWHLLLWSIKIWKRNDPSEALITSNYKRIADSVWLSLYIRDNEYVQHLSRPLAPKYTKHLLPIKLATRLLFWILFFSIAWLNLTYSSFWCEKN
jgi:hypothetical protein